MKKLYLASSIDVTAAGVAKDIGKDPKRLRMAFIFYCQNRERQQRLAG